MAKWNLRSAGLWLLLWGAFNGLNAQVIDENYSQHDLKESLWKGFDRFDFGLGPKQVRLIIPNHPLPGNPWIWRAEKGISAQRQL